MNYKIKFIYSDGDDTIKIIDILGRKVSYEYDILHDVTKKIVDNGNAIYTLMIIETM